METLENPAGVLGSCNSEDLVNGAQENAVKVFAKGSVLYQSSNGVVNSSSLVADKCQLNELPSVNGVKENDLVVGENDIDGVVKSVNDVGRSREDNAIVGGGVLLVVDVQGSSNGYTQDNVSELVEVEVKLDKDATTDVGQKELFEVNCVIIPENEESTVTMEENRIVVYEEQKELEIDDEEEEEEDCKFSVGEIVWAKTLNRPWWPGQIYDPADASKDITMYYRKDRVLVAFFGDDEPSAWCYPSLVKPFQRKYRQMSMLGNSSAFRNAVDEALRRIGRCVELGMTCSCVSQETLTKDVGPLASNSGIREGVVVPEGRILGLSLTEFEPAKFLARLRCLAEAVSEVSQLERTVYRSQLSAFNSANKWRHPQIYLELQDNSDCAGNNGYATTDVFDFHDPTEEPLVGSSLIVSNFIASNSSAEKVNHKKRRRMNFHLPSAFRKKRQKKNFDDGIKGDLAEVGSTSTSKAQQEAKHSGSPPAFPGSNNLTLQNDDIEAKEVNRTGSLSRERRKSKYLSPPYTMLSPEYKSLISLKDSVPNSPKVPKVSYGEDYVGRAGGLTRCSGETIRKKPCSGKKIEANVDVSEILSELYCASLDPMYLHESNQYDIIKGFFLDLRSYQHGSDHQKALGAEPGSPENDIYKTDLQLSEDDTERGERKEDALSNSPQRNCMDISLGLSEEDMHKTGSKSSGGTKRKARDWKEAARAQISQKKSVDRPVGSLGEDMRETNCPTSAGGAEKGGDWVEDAKVQNFQRKVVNIAVGSPGQYEHKTNGPTSEGGPKKRGRKRKSALPESLQNRPELAAPVMNKTTQSVNIPLGSPREDLANQQTSEVGPKKRGRKRKSVLSESVQIRPELAAPLMNKTKTTQSVNIPLGSPRQDLPNQQTSEVGAKKRGRKRKRDALSNSRLQIRSEHAASFAKKKEETSSAAALLLNFGPGVPLPRKEDLITLFGRFGALNELETEVKKDCGCAQVVYQSRSNAEEALNSSQKISPFGAAVVNYRIESYTTNSTAWKPKVKSQSITLPVYGNALTPLSALPPIADGPPLQFVRQNLESMTSMLEKAGDKLPPEVKANLENEIKRLLKKVETISQPSS